MKTVILIIAAAVSLIAGTGIIHWQSQADTLRGRAIRERGVILDQVQHRLEDKVANFTKGWLNLGEERRQRYAELESEGKAAQIWANQAALVTAGALGLTTFIGLFVEAAARRKVFGLISLYCWLLGILLPVLTIAVHTQIPQIGQVILREETKSLLILIQKLWLEHNILLVSLIGVFGVLVPLIKTTCQLLPDSFGPAHQIGGFLARWALIDVVVVGVIVGFLGMKNDAETTATVRLGLGFFAASGFLSVAASALAKRA